MSQIELLLRGCLAVAMCLIKMNCHFRAMADLSAGQEQLRTEASTALNAQG